MTRPRPTPFVARDGYRLRRVMDAARFLPVAGLVLLLLPLLRDHEDAVGPPTAAESVYLFVVWGGLVLAALLISLVLRRVQDVPPTETSTETRTEAPTGRTDREE